MNRWPRVTDDPRQLPELRHLLLDLAHEDGAWERTEMERCMGEMVGDDAVHSTDGHGRPMITGTRGYGPDELPLAIDLAWQRGRKAMEWYRQTLAAAQLLYVHPDLVALVVEAAKAVPDEVSVSPDDLPAPSGLVVLGAPIYGTDAGPERPGAHIQVDGLMWGTSRIPPDDVDWLDPKVIHTERSLTVGSLRMVDNDDEGELAAMTQALAMESGYRLPLWFPMGRSDWPYHTPINQPVRPGLTEAAITSMMEDRRFIAALFAVLKQRRLVTFKPWEPRNRAAKQRAARKGYRGVVKVVHLRRPTYEPIDPARPASGRHVGVRFPVRPFPRMQPYGPGGKLRRLIIVPGHWKGPIGAPVVHPERIWSLDR